MDVEVKNRTAGRVTGFGIAVLFWVLFGAYLGLAGLAKFDLDDNVRSIEDQRSESKSQELEWRGEVYSSPKDLRIAVLQGQLEGLFPWVFRWPHTIILVLTCGGFGILGATTRSIYDEIQDRVPMSWVRVTFVPMVGFLSGVWVFGIATLLPLALAAQTSTPHPRFLILYCLIAGLFWDQFLLFLKSIAERLFLLNKDL